MRPIHHVPVILLGLGNVGRVLLRQILETREVVAQRTGLHLTLLALADVSGVLYDPDGLPEESLWAAQQAAQSGQLLNTLPGILPLPEIEAMIQPDVILADVTASPKTELYLHSAKAVGAGIVLANKIPLGGAWSSAKALLDYPRLRYEVTVGAGLPVIGTLRDLLDTGDEVTFIEGCMSGTLGYLCAELEQETCYSDAVRQARALGYTEPDPRDDLGGRDVARKALILARTAGWPLEIDDLTIEPLYSEALAGLSVDEFLAQASSLDDEYAYRVQSARTEGQVLRYMAQVEPEGGRVGLVAVPYRSPLGALHGPANYIAFYTRRYDTLPLVVSGPGAGPEVTAAGVLADILTLARSVP